MRSKLTSVSEAVSLCEPGMAVALGGAVLRRKPMALVRALADRRTGDLQLWTWVGSLDIDLLIGTGLVQSVDSAYVGFGPFGLAQTARRAYAEGSVTFRDWSETSIMSSFRAGATDTPVALTRALVGTSLSTEFASKISHPFGGPPTLCVPAARPDIAFLHAQSADERGNIRRRRPGANDDIDHVIAASARKVVVSVEEIESHTITLKNRDEIIIPGHHVAAVCHAPRGAHPTGCDGYYHPDSDHLEVYATSSRDAEGIESYLHQYVYGIPHEAYLEQATPLEGNTP